MLSMLTHGSHCSSSYVFQFCHEYLIIYANLCWEVILGYKVDSSQSEKKESASLLIEQNRIESTTSPQSHKIQVGQSTTRNKNKKEVKLT